MIAAIFGGVPQWPVHQRAAKACFCVIFACIGTDRVIDGPVYQLYSQNECFNTTHHIPYPNTWLWRGNLGECFEDQPELTVSGSGVSMGTHIFLWNSGRRSGSERLLTRLFSLAENVQHHSRVPTPDRHVWIRPGHLGIIGLKRSRHLRSPSQRQHSSAKCTIFLTLEDCHEIKSFQVVLGQTTVVSRLKCDQARLQTGSTHA